MEKIEERYINKVKKQHNILLVLFLYSFLFTDIVKEILIYNLGINLKIGIFPILVIIYLSIYYRRNNWSIFLIIFVIIYNILSAINYGYGVNSLIRFLNMILLPILLTTIKIYNIKILYKKILKTINVFVVIYVSIGLIDYITNGIIRGLMISLLKESYYSKSMLFDILSGSYRWFSFFGHALVNTSYMLIFFIANIIYIKKYKDNVKLSKYMVYLISIIGIILSNSKFGLIIMGLLLILNITNEKNKIVYFVTIVSIVIISINTPFFKNNVIGRFQYAIESGDITNGRATVLEALLDRNTYDIDIFLGKGMASSDRLVKDIFGAQSGLTNMEIPFLMFLYEYGVFSTLVIYLILYIYPAYLLLVRKSINMLIFMSLLFLFLNSFNGIATGSGIMLLYSYMVMLFINISNACNNNNEICVNNLN